MDLIELGDKGVTKDALVHLTRYLDISLSQMAELLSITERTIQRYTMEKSFNRILSEQILQIAEVAARGTEVFGDKDKFLLWLKQPNRALGNKTPINLLGSRLYGGRWNRKGIGIIYTSETRALATLEYLVHLPLSLMPDDISISSIEIPDNIISREILISDLPINWRSWPAPTELAELGTRWVLSNETLLLRVPSAVVQHEFNILINPSHPDMKQVTILNIEEYRFDRRLIR